MNDICLAARLVIAQEELADRESDSARLPVAEAFHRVYFRHGRRFTPADPAALNRAEAQSLYAKAAGLGEAMAMFHLARLAREEPESRTDPMRAFEMFHAASKAGDAAGQRELALLYAAGHGLRQNLVEARQWMEKAAAQGDEEARAWLAKADTFCADQSARRSLL